MLNAPVMFLSFPNQYWRIHYIHYYSSKNAFMTRLKIYNDSETVGVLIPEKI